MSHSSSHWIIISRTKHLSRAPNKKKKKRISHRLSLRYHLRISDTGVLNIISDHGRRQGKRGGKISWHWKLKTTCLQSEWGKVSVISLTGNDSNFTSCWRILTRHRPFSTPPPHFPSSFEPFPHRLPIRKRVKTTPFAYWDRNITLYLKKKRKFNTACYDFKVKRTFTEQTDNNSFLYFPVQLCGRSTPSDPVVPFCRFPLNRGVQSTSFLLRHVSRRRRRRRETSPSAFFFLNFVEKSVARLGYIRRKLLRESGDEEEESRPVLLQIVIIVVRVLPLRQFFFHTWHPLRCVLSCAILSSRSLFFYPASFDVIYYLIPSSSLQTKLNECPIRFFFL